LLELGTTQMQLLT